MGLKHNISIISIFVSLNPQHFKKNFNRLKSKDKEIKQE